MCVERSVATVVRTLCTHMPETDEDEEHEEHEGDSSKRRQNKSDLIVHNVEEATQLVRDLIQQQLTLDGSETVEYTNETNNGRPHSKRKASDLKQAGPRSVMQGDGYAKKLFYTLLPPTMQREIFRDVASTDRHLPRINSLFGSPPYAFLHSGDAGLFRAGGFAHSRTNMTYVSAPDGNGDHHVPNYSQFGEAQMHDSVGRDYRVHMRGEHGQGSSALGVHAIMGTITLVVRLKRLTRNTRIEKERSEEGRRSLSFPRIGEQLLLRETKIMKRLSGAGRDVTVRVGGFFTNAPRSATAFVYVQAVE